MSRRWKILIKKHENAKKSLRKNTEGTKIGKIIEKRENANKSYGKNTENTKK